MIEVQNLSKSYINKGISSTTNFFLTFFFRNFLRFFLTKGCIIFDIILIFFLFNIFLIRGNL